MVSPRFLRDNLAPLLKSQNLLVSQLILILLLPTSSKIWYSFSLSIWMPRDPSKLRNSTTSSAWKYSEHCALVVMTHSFSYDISLMAICSSSIPVESTRYVSPKSLKVYPNSPIVSVSMKEMPFFLRKLFRK